MLWSVNPHAVVGQPLLLQLPRKAPYALHTAAIRRLHEAWSTHGDLLDQHGEALVQVGECAVDHVEARGRAGEGKERNVRTARHQLPNDTCGAQGTSSNGFTSGEGAHIWIPAKTPDVPRDLHPVGAKLGARPRRYRRARRRSWHATSAALA